MEKIININMAGRVIAIEDRAYTRLKSYIESLHRYFAGQEGEDEIMNDIESRIAELMDEKIHRGSQAIDEAAVEEIIGSIGRVEDFAASEEENAASEAQAAQTTRRNRRGSRRFNRDVNDKILGGVCSGLANYLDVDPALVRIVFAILTLGGWGLGLALYVLLWIFVPAAPLESYRGRRLFRDTEDKWIGGVCSGIAAYFDTETWIVRLIFAAPFVLSMFSGSFGFFDHAPIVFGSFTGTFVLIYIVLWIVLPLARTDFQKMEMRGEKVDLQRIRDNVMSDMKDRAKNFSQEVNEAASRVSKEASNFMNTRGKDFAREAADAARPIARTGGQVIGSILKGILIFFGCLIAFFLFFLLIGYAFGGVSGFVNDFLFRTPQQRTLAWITVLLCLGIPLLALVTMMVRRALRLRTGGRYFAIGYSLLWTAGIICMIWLIAAVVKDFRRQETLISEVPIQQPDSNGLILTVPGAPIEYGNGLAFLQGEIHGFDIGDGIIRTAGVGVVPRISPDSQYHIIIKRSSMGGDRREAQARAEQIEYHLRSVSDSVVEMDNGYQISRETGWRWQAVWVEVQVPAGRKIRFDESVEDKLFEVDFPNRRSYRYGVRHGRPYYAHTIEYDENEEWESGVSYMMGADGSLKDLSSRRFRDHAYDDSIARQEEAAARATENAQREMDRRRDSLDREIDAIERRKEQLEREAL